MPERLGRERLRRHLWGQKGRLGFGLLCLLLRHSCSLSIPWSLKYALESLKGTPDLYRVKLYALFIFGAALGQGLFRYLYRMSFVGASFEIERELRHDLLAHLQRLPASFYARARTGDLLSRATHDLEGVRAFVSIGLISLFFTVVVYLSTLPVLLWINPLLTLYTLAAYPVVLVLVKRRGRLLFRQSLRAQQQLSSLNVTVQENLRGADMIRAYLLEERATEGFARASQGYLEANLALARSRIWLSSLMYAAIGVGMAVAFWKGGEAVIAGQMSLGSFVAFNLYLAMLIFPTLELGITLNVLQRGLASMARIEELFQKRIRKRPEEIEARPPESKISIPEFSDSARPPPLRGEIVLEGVYLIHPAEDGRAAPPLLKGVYLQVRPGQRLGIVGPVGSGKSLLAALVAGLLRASEGSLRIDGHEIERLPRAILRKAIGYLPQEPFLFSGSVLENIAFGLEEADPQRIMEAARVAQLLGEIEGWPQGFETRIGERGLRLSGGQKQRLALARALAVDPQILILDDPFSQVDLLTEERILEGLLPLLQGKTCLLISSRVSSLRGVDRVAVLAEGRIVEEGRPDELLRQGGVYAGIYRQQQMQRELELY